MYRPGYASALLAGLLLAIPAGAQPARNGNVYNGTAHQPAPGPVHGNESAAGVALPQQQEQQRNKEVETLNKQLTDKANHDPAKGTPTPPPPNASGR